MIFEIKINVYITHLHIYFLLMNFSLNVYSWEINCYVYLNKMMVKQLKIIVLCISIHSSFCTINKYAEMANKND